MTPGETRYRPDIDGLRAVAVGAVIVYHAFPSVRTSAADPPAAFYAPWSRLWELALGAVLVSVQRQSSAVRWHAPIETWRAFPADGSSI